MAKILIVTHTPDSTPLVDSLSQEDHLVDTDDGIESALGSLRSRKYDLIILRKDFPALTTEAICRDFRSACPSSAILMLSDRPSLEELENALDSGADDYLADHADPREVHARVRALARRYVQDYSR